MERIGVKMLSNFLWFIIGVMSAFLGIAVFFIGGGFITRFKQIYKIKNYGKGPRQAVTQDKLTDLEKFTSQVKIKYNHFL